MDWIVCNYGNCLNSLCSAIVLLSESGAWSPWGKKWGREAKVVESQKVGTHEYELDPSVSSHCLWLWWSVCLSSWSDTHTWPGLKKVTGGSKRRHRSGCCLFPPHNSADKWQSAWAMKMLSLVCLLLHFCPPNLTFKTMSLVALKTKKEGNSGKCSLTDSSWRIIKPTNHPMLLSSKIVLSTLSPLHLHINVRINTLLL